MSAEKVAFAREWYARGECPGCGGPLAETAGQGERHYRGGQRVVTNGKSGFRVTEAGERIRSGGNLHSDDPRLCPWTADDLTALVHIGSGLVGAP